MVLLFVIWELSVMSMSFFNRCTQYSRSWETSTQSCLKETPGCAGGPTGKQALIPERHNCHDVATEVWLTSYKVPLWLLNGEEIVRGKSGNGETSQRVTMLHGKDIGDLHNSSNTGKAKKKKGWVGGEGFRHVWEVELHPGFGLKN